MIELYLWFIMFCAVVFIVVSFTAFRFLELSITLIIGGHYHEAMKYFAACFVLIVVSVFAFNHSFAGVLFE